jgi:hypothetical protein
MVDTAFERGFKRYSDFEAMSEDDQAVAIAYTQTIKRMRAVEIEMAPKPKETKPKGRR